MRKQCQRVDYLDPLLVVNDGYVNLLSNYLLKIFYLILLFLFWMINRFLSVVFNEWKTTLYLHVGVSTLYERFFILYIDKFGDPDG